jgi:hypothetical protein
LNTRTFDEHCKPWRFSLCKLLQSPGASFLLQTSTLYSNIFNLCSSFNMRQTFSHAHKTTLL